MEETKKVGLSFGIMSEPISKQLKTQGFKFNKETIKDFQEEINAINVLRFSESDLLTDKMLDKIIPKLHKKIVQHVAKQNKLSVVKNPIKN